LPPGPGQGHQDHARHHRRAARKLRRHGILPAVPVHRHRAGAGRIRLARAAHPRHAMYPMYAAYTATKNAPSCRWIVLRGCPTNMNTKSRIVTPTITPRSRLYAVSNGTSCTIELNPSTMKMLKMFEPTTLPTAMSAFLR